MLGDSPATSRGRDEPAHPLADGRHCAATVGGSEPSGRRHEVGAKSDLHFRWLEPRRADLPQVERPAGGPRSGRLPGEELAVADRAHAPAGSWPVIMNTCRATAAQLAGSPMTSRCRLPRRLDTQQVGDGGSDVVGEGEAPTWSSTTAGVAPRTASARLVATTLPPSPTTQLVRTTRQARRRTGEYCGLARRRPGECVAQRRAGLPGDLPLCSGHDSVPDLCSAGGGASCRAQHRAVGAGSLVCTHASPMT